MSEIDLTRNILTNLFVPLFYKLANPSLQTILNQIKCDKRSLTFQDLKSSQKIRTSPSPSTTCQTRLWLQRKPEYCAQRKGPTYFDVSNASQNDSLNQIS